jgi:DNA-binding GntR family transcriptional regulator
VSRTPIRDALKRLALENFVEISISYGTFVSKITSDVILEIYSIREVLEGLACRLYTKRISPADKRELRKMNDRFVQAMLEKAYEEAVRIDIRFHGKIIGECGSATLVSLLSPITEQISRITYSTHYDAAWAEETIRLHNAICDSIVDGDAGSAETAMREHIMISRNKHITTLMQ